MYFRRENESLVLIRNKLEKTLGAQNKIKTLHCFQNHSHKNKHRTRVAERMCTLDEMKCEESLGGSDAAV